MSAEEGVWRIRDGVAERRPRTETFLADGVENLTYNNPKLRDDQEPERVEGQYNIYDSVPGMEQYSPLWQFNYVVVPRDYEPNSLRSEVDCLRSGYPIRKSTIIEN